MKGGSNMGYAITNSPIVIVGGSIHSSKRVREEALKALPNDHRLTKKTYKKLARMYQLLFV